MKVSNSSPRDSAAFEVREALAHSGCPICHLTMRSVGRLLKSVAYEQVNDIALRAELRAARGFCNTHAHRWLREAHSALGTALIYRDVLMSAARDLLGNQQPADTASGRLLRTFLKAERSPRRRERTCPACRAQREADERYIEVLLGLLESDEQVRERFAGTQGLCLRHVRLATARGGAAVDQVLEQTRRGIERLVEDLDEVIRKHDYRFRHEPRTDSQRSAPARAISLAAGLEGLVDRD
jgi:hypothetical protein